MVSTPVAQLSFKPTGAAQKTSLGQWAQDLGGYNVKNFGALGDGSTDDTAAIQLCFDTTFGIYSNPHGTTNRFLNRPVYFPPGHYMVSAPLIMRFVSGGLIEGAGSDATIIEYNGPVPGVSPPWYSGAGYNGGHCTCLIAVNGMGYSAIKHLTLKMTGFIDGPSNKVFNSSTLSHTCCFNWDWIHDDTMAQQQGNTALVWEDVHFMNATYGITMGSDQVNSQSDTGLFLNCKFTNLFQGIVACNFNCLTHAVVGCVFTNCNSPSRETAAIYIEGGNIPSIIGNSFVGNQRNYANDSQTGGVIFGMTCTDRHFTFISGSTIFAGCRHENALLGQFMRGFIYSTVIDACTIQNSTFQSGGFYIRGGTTFGQGGIPIVGSNGFVREWMTGGPLTFAQLPQSGYLGDGLRVNISDGSTNVWGATVTGGGANHVSIRWNGSSWTVVGK